MRHYFDRPTQLKFWDADVDHYVGGIGYKNDIICGCCGDIIDPEEIIRSTPMGIDPIVVLDWIDIGYAITGELI